jgi:hypothetical protein
LLLAIAFTYWSARDWLEGWYTFVFPVIFTLFFRYPLWYAVKLLTWPTRWSWRRWRVSGQVTDLALCATFSFLLLPLAFASAYQGTVTANQIGDEARADKRIEDALELQVGRAWGESVVADDDEPLTGAAYYVRDADGQLLLLVYSSDDEAASAALDPPSLTGPHASLRRGRLLLLFERGQRQRAAQAIEAAAVALSDVDP